MCVKCTFFSVENVSFYREHQQTIFLGLFWTKTNKDHITIFQCKPGVTCSEKSLLWQFCNNYGHSSRLESLCFYLELQKTIFLGLFCPLLTEIFNLNHRLTQEPLWDREGSYGVGRDMLNFTTVFLGCNYTEVQFLRRPVCSF